MSFVNDDSFCPHDNIFTNGCFEQSHISSSACPYDIEFPGYSIFPSPKNQLSSEFDENLNIIQPGLLESKSSTWNDHFENEILSPIDHQLINGRCENEILSPIDQQLINGRCENEILSSIDHQLINGHCENEILSSIDHQLINGHCENQILSPIDQQLINGHFEDETLSPIDQKLTSNLLPAQDVFSNYDLTVPEISPFFLLRSEDQHFLSSPISATNGKIPDKYQRKSKSFSKLNDKGSDYLKINTPQTPVRKTTSSSNLIGFKQPDYNLGKNCSDSNKEFQIDGKYFSTPSLPHHHLPLSPPPTKPCSEFEIGLKSSRDPSLSSANNFILENTHWIGSPESIEYSREQKRYPKNLFYQKHADNQPHTTTPQEQQPLLDLSSCESVPTSSATHNINPESTLDFLWPHAEHKNAFKLSSRSKSLKSSNKTVDCNLSTDNPYFNGCELETRNEIYRNDTSTRDNLPNQPLLTTTNHHQRFSYPEKELRNQREESPCVQVRKRKSKRAIKLNSTQGSSSDTCFLNLTQNDSRKILAGVAPSGSNKTKARRDKEAIHNKREWTRSVFKAMQKAAAAGRDWRTIAKEEILDD